MLLGCLEDLFEELEVRRTCGMSVLNRICIFLHGHEDLNGYPVPVLVGKPHSVGLRPTREVLALVTARDEGGKFAPKLGVVPSLELRSKFRDCIGVAPWEERPGLEVNCLLIRCILIRVLVLDQVVFIGNPQS